MIYIVYTVVYNISDKFINKYIVKLEKISTVSTPYIKQLFK